MKGIKGSNEQLFNTTIHIVAKEAVKKEVRAVLRQNGYKYSENFARQVDGFISSNISRLDKLQKMASKKNLKVYSLKEDEFIKNLDSLFIKAVAITDKNLSDAIKKELD